MPGLRGLRRKAPQIGLGVVLVAIFLGHVALGYLPLVGKLEHILYDTRLNLLPPDTTAQSIVIVDIDERSLLAEGRWPWGRDKVARLVETLFEDYAIRLLGFDIVFAEPDESSGLPVLDALAEAELADSAEFAAALDRLRPQLDHDGIFARTLKRYPVVLGYYFNPTLPGLETPRVNVPPQPVLGAKAFEGQETRIQRFEGFTGNLAPLQNAAIAGGHFNLDLDSDGVVRRVPMLFEHDGQYYESLSLAMARLSMDSARVRPFFVGESSSDYSGLEGLYVGERFLPVDDKALALVPYRGKSPAFPYVSATDVLNREADGRKLEDAIVLMGTTAPGLKDLRVTPVEENYPGVEVHANLIAGILEESVMRMPQYVLGAEFLIILFLGLLMAIAMPLLSPLLTSLSVVAAVAFVVATNIYFWSAVELVLPLAATLVMLLALYLLNMSYGYFVETLGKRQLSGLFGQYIPPELVDEMSEDPASYSLAPSSRNLTVLFSDVRGFTTLSEGLEPNQLAELINGFLTPMTRVIHHHRGTIDKYMGDAIMAFWGAPIPDSDHAHHAVEAALAMVKELDAINAEFRRRGWPDIKIGIGVNTGLMNVGDMGSNFRKAYTVMGDAVNLGSRLEGRTKSYGVPIIVGEATRAAASEFAYRELDRVRVKGKAEPVAIFEPLGRKAELAVELKNELKLYRQALEYYRSQQWDQAELQFMNLKRVAANTQLCEAYLERIKTFRGSPPGKDWDGVFAFATK